MSRAVRFSKAQMGHYLIADQNTVIGEISRNRGKNEYAVRFIDQSLSSLFRRPYTSLQGAKRSVERYFEEGEHPRARQPGMYAAKDEAPDADDEVVELSAAPEPAPELGLVLSQETIWAIHNLAEAAYEGDATVERCLDELLDCLHDEMAAVYRESRRFYVPNGPPVPPAKLAVTPVRAWSPHDV